MWYNPDTKMIHISNEIFLKYLYHESLNKDRTPDVKKYYNYHIGILFSTYSSKEHVVNIKAKNENCGSIIPLEALKNKSDEVDNDKTLAWRSFIAYLFYLKHSDTIERFSNDESKICFLIIQKEIISTSSFKPIKWSLKEYGYYECPHYNNTLVVPNYKPNLNLTPCSKYLSTNPYVIQYFSSFCYIEDPIQHFLYSYQIIELLMEDLNIYNALESIQNYRCHSISNRERNGNNSTELTLFNTLTDFTSCKNPPEFIVACNLFLASAGRNKPVEKFPDALYQVRNTIVHNLRNVCNTEAKNKLKLVNSHFDLFILDIVSAYRINSTIYQNNLYDSFDKLYKDIQGEVE